MFNSFNNQGLVVEVINWRQRALLDAAFQCFLDRGIRGTSMEFVAQQAGVAKATLYKYFADKNVLFDAVVSHLLEQVKKEIAPVLDAEGPVADVVSAFLIAKHSTIDEAVEGSAHRNEFFTAYRSGAILAFADFESWVRSEIASLLKVNRCEQPELLANIVTAAVGGITREKSEFVDWQAAVSLTVRRLIQDTST